MHGQLDFSDVLSVSGELRYQDGDFATLKSDGRSPKPNLSDANTSLDVNGSASLNINKFFKDDWGLRLPFGIGYSSTTLRPYLKPDDDVQLSHDNAVDMFGDFSTASLEMKSLQEEDSLRQESESKGYQSFSRARTLSIGFTKEYKKSDNIFKEILGQIFLERPALNYSYRETERRSAKVADSSYQYNTVLEYKLGTFERTNTYLFSNKNLPVEFWPSTFDLTLMDLDYRRNVYQERDPNFMDPQVDKITNFATDLSHKADIRWNILPFLTMNYTLNINRDMYNGGDRQAFTKEDFFSPEGEGGLFAKNFIFDHDHTDRKVYYSGNVYSYAIDTLYNEETGETNVVYQENSSYEIDSIGSREYGRAYGILRNERDRRQDFRVNFSPLIIPFLPMRFSFNSGFNQSKSIPNDFNFFNEDYLSKNFWTIQQNNRFEFSPSLRLPQFAGIAGKNAVSDFFEKLKWREIRSTWSVDLQTNGEDFTLWQLHEEQGVDPLQYYLFGLGIGNGYRNRGFWNLVSGDMGLDSHKDYERFAQYRNNNVDSLVYQNRFEHAVKRSLSTNTSLTLPFWDIGLRGDLAWSETFRQSREQTRDNPLLVDTTTIWPRFGIGMDIPNFVNRLNFLKGRLRSLSTSHRFDYQKQYTVRPFQSSEDEWGTTIALDPIIRISALTNGNIRIDNSLRFKMEEKVRRPKIEIPETEDYEEEYYIKIPWLHTDKIVDRGYGFGDELAISYALKTKRGFQLWRWYVKLDNDIDLRLESAYNYKILIQESYKPVSEFTDPRNPEGSIGIHNIYYNPIEDEYVTSYMPALDGPDREVPTRAHEWYIRPRAAYSFSKLASASAYIEYRWLRELLSYGGTHTRQSLSFEIAAMLRFN
jgi:cell surface protein SprA